MRFDPLLWAQNAAQLLFALPLLGQKWRRWKRRRENYEWDFKRWNPPAIAPKTDKKRLVLVAMGFAETRLAAEITRQLQALQPNWEVVWAIRNREAAQNGGALSASSPPVVPMPFDFAPAVANWLRVVQPEGIVFIERFAFANFARFSYDKGVGVGAIAARTRQNRREKTPFGAMYRRWLYRSFSLICLRSDDEFRAMQSDAPASALRITGSLKFWPQLPPLDEARSEALQSWIAQTNGRPILVAGSTQPGDESWILAAFKPLHEKYNAVLLLAPRNPPRADQIETLCLDAGLKVSRRSTFPKNDSIGPDVLLLDTVGELAHAYGAGVAAFVGGTISGTGHNVLEPVFHGVPVFFGPKRGTFGAEQDMCEQTGIGFRVATSEALCEGWQKALNDEPWRAQVREKALQFAAQGARAWDETVKALSDWMDER